MEVLERIRSFIDGFAGYAGPDQRRVSDEQIRSYVGEVLAELPAVQIDNLSDAERSNYDRALLRCEFVNQAIFRTFDTDPTPRRIEATLTADVRIVEAAAALIDVQSAMLDGLLKQLCDAFDERDAAMQIA